MKVEGWQVRTPARASCRPARCSTTSRSWCRHERRCASSSAALDATTCRTASRAASLVWATDAVRDLLAMLAAIDDPDDRSPSCAALRSPGFACSDADLARVGARRGPVDRTVAVAHRGDRGRPSGGGRAWQRSAISIAERYWLPDRRDGRAGDRRAQARRAHVRSAPARATTGAGCASSSTRPVRSWKRAARRSGDFVCVGAAAG